MLSAAFFGVHCELHDRVTSSQVVHDHFTLSRQEAEALAGGRLAKNDLLPECSVGPQPVRGSVPFETGWFRRRSGERRKRREQEVSLIFVEFVELSDSRRVVVRSDRGLNRGSSDKRGPWYGETCEGLAHSVRECFRQYEVDRPSRPEWVSDRLQRLYGIDVDYASIEAALRAPRQVELGLRLRQVLPV